MAKPASWAWDADLVVNDGHRVLAQAATFLVPLWEGTGTPADLVIPATASSTAGGWVTNTDPVINGPAWRIDANSEFVRFASNAAFHLDGDINFSWLITLVNTGVPAQNFFGLIGVRTTNITGVWMAYYDVVNTNLTWTFHSGVSNHMRNFGADLTNAAHMVCGSRTASDNTYRVWVDGTLRNSIVHATTPVGGTHDLNISILGNDQTLTQHFADYALLVIWKNYALVQADVDLLFDGTAAGATHGFGLLEEQGPIYTQTKFQIFNDDGTGLGPPP